jgi:hypothetical protein
LAGAKLAELSRCNRDQEVLPQRHRDTEIVALERRTPPLRGGPLTTKTENASFTTISRLAFSAFVESG